MTKLDQKVTIVMAAKEPRRWPVISDKAGRGAGWGRGESQAGPDEALGLPFLPEEAEEGEPRLRGIPGQPESRHSLKPATQWRT